MCCKLSLPYSLLSMLITVEYWCWVRSAFRLSDTVCWLVLSKVKLQLPLIIISLVGLCEAVLGAFSLGIKIIIPSALCKPCFDTLADLCSCHITADIYNLSYPVPLNWYRVQSVFVIILHPTIHQACVCKPVVDYFFNLL